LQEFRSQGVWRIQDKDGSDDVVLERSFGSESYVSYSAEIISPAERT
jgi:hypothetical protein